jgi:hypothetical protein
MKELENYTLKEVTDMLIEDISKEKQVSKSLARKLLINALSYNVVMEQISNQIDFLLEID